MCHTLNQIKLYDNRHEETHSPRVMVICANFNFSTAKTTTFMSTGSCTHAENDETLHSLDAKVLPPVFCCNSMPNFKFLI
jgi:hypothetical protein